MVIRKTVYSEIPELTRISKTAFDTDNLVGNPETGGPPDHDSEAAAACIRFAFEKHDFPAVYSYMKHTNIPSQQTAMKNGMRFVEEYEDPDNTYTRVYVINRKEWEEQHET